ncbi:MerR family transcriptional regulator [Tissierella pigra]|uniref:MerR family transcriptional regulator n=1 Tax=Tissierella pigra TaxID=2607614 RepID=A0A6N7Y3G5_9FIRM|nr:MerR family transcriptional regulator [Tissierella pigra]MBU5428014.1 MerR family transcriptional regulator [Tissierella pigra]MSU03335.1 MerR family transcriptional regulator [Tissierella pigra]
MLFIKDICRITGLNSSAVRYYDSQGLLGEIKRRDNNYRIFDEKDIEKLFFIKKARSLGFELEEIKKILMLKNNGIAPCSYVSNKIQEKVSFIKMEISRLEKEKDKLEKHLSDARKTSGCKGSICHYIEGIEEQDKKIGGNVI